MKLSVGLWFKDRLDGLPNYNPCKERINLALMVNKIWEFSKKEIQKPTNPKELEVNEELDTKVKLIILDCVKNHLIPHMSRKNTAKEMWKAL